MNEIFAALFAPNKSMAWIIGLLAIGVLLFKFMITATVFSSTIAYTNPKPKDDPLKEAGVNVVNRLDRDGERFTAFYLGYSQHDQLSKERGVHFSIKKRMKDILEPGEAMPSEDFMSLYADTRSDFIGQEECKLLLRDLAKECEAGYIKTRVDDGIVTFRGTLRFVAKAEKLQADPSIEWRFDRSTDKMRPKKRPVSFSRATNERISFYKSVAEKCEKLKKIRQDCSPIFIELWEQIDRKSGRLFHSGSTVFGFLEPTHSS